MKEVEIQEHFRHLEQQLATAGEAVEGLRRDQRAEIDALRLEMEILRRCLLLAHPHLKEHFETLREQVVQETDPEAP